MHVGACRAGRQPSTLLSSRQRRKEAPARRRAGLVTRATYRWTPEEEGPRKRESLWDNAEPSSSASEAWREEQQPAAAAGATEGAWEQGAWEAGGEGAGQPRARRTSRRRAQQQQQQQEEEQPEQQEEAAAAASSSSSLSGNGVSGAPLEELQQLRARQARRARRRAAAAAAGDSAEQPAAPLPGGWSEEWGPAPESTPPPEDTWGWGAESWAPGSAEEEASASAPGSGGAYAQQQQQRGGRAAGRRAGGLGGEAEQEGEEWEGSEAWQREQQWQYSERQGQYSEPYAEEYQPGVSSEPDIALLSTEELERVLPVVPFSQQASFFNGSATDGVQRWGASLALTVLLSKVALLAATSLTWPLWWPWALAAKRNYSLRQQSRHAGLWRTQVLSITSTGRPKPRFGAPGGGGGWSGGGGGMGSTMRMAKVLLGDPGGAQTEMTLPFDSRYELIQGGEPVEMVVLSSDPSFQQLKAVKDAYLPGSGLWLSEYPYLERTEFLELSLAVEREAAAAREAQQQQQQGAPPPGYGGGNGGWQPGDEYGGY